MPKSSTYPDGMLDGDIESILIEERREKAFKKCSIRDGEFYKAPDFQRWAKAHMYDVAAEETMAYRYVLEEARKNGGWENFCAISLNELDTTLKELLSSQQPNNQGEAISIQASLYLLRQAPEQKKTFKIISYYLLTFFKKAPPPLAEKAASLCFTLYALLVTKKHGGIEKYDQELQMIEKKACRAEIKKIAKSLRDELEFKMRLNITLTLGALFSGTTRSQEYDQKLESYDFAISLEDQQLITNIRNQIENLLQQVKEGSLPTQAELIIMRDWKITINRLQDTYLWPALKKITTLNPPAEEK